jgi:lipopolysaccharide/colanic/teichoic acid biosynthesis glycosyltransferase
MLQYTEKQQNVTDINTPVDEFKEKPVYGFFKRLFDIVLSALFLLILSPVFLVLIIMISLLYSLIKV